MVTNNKRIPTKLKNDAIVEALFEIRFDMTTIPEVFFGRLADHDSWKGFQQNRMPAYNLPASVRQSDPSLRYQAVFELKDTKQNRVLRIGANVLSYHRLSPYIGWDKFKPEIDEVVDALFSTTEALNIRRMGLRYMNAIRPELHNLQSISDLDLKVIVANEDISGNVNINFTSELSEDSECTLRIATTEFIQGAIPKDTSVFVDVDVYTKDNFRTKDAQKVKQWVEFAHGKEKEQFFRLLTQDSIDVLEEK